MDTKQSNEIQVEVVYASPTKQRLVTLTVEQGTTAVCLDLSVVKAQYAPGVSEPSAVTGFTSDEVKAMVKQMGGVQVVLVTEYNPAIEKFKTGGLITDIFSTLIHTWIS